MRSADFESLTATATAVPRGAEGNTAEPGLPGLGLVSVASVRGKSTIIRMRATSPLKLLAPRSHGRAAWICASTYGGGLVTGDVIPLNLRAGESTTTLLGTQASTKVYPAIDGLGCAQRLNVNADSDAVVVVAPDPVVPFAGAIYEQQQRFDLFASSTLVLIDWLSSGRRARGERWAFSRYSSRTQIVVAGKIIYRDATLLDAGDGPLDSPQRMGRCDCYATILVVGPRAKSPAEALLAWIADQPIARSEPLLFAGSPVPGGAVVRVAGESTESVGRWIRQKLAFVCDWLGEDPWSRKW